MEKGVFYGLLLFFAGILLGSSGNMQSCGPLQVEGLVLVDSSSSLSHGANNSISIYNYEITLHNGGQKDIYVTNIKIVPAPGPYDIIFQDSGIHEVNSVIKSGSSLTIGGSAEIGSYNTTKEEIADFTPILALNVSSAESIPYFIYKN